ncbi:hypothetical protein Trydic_g4530 [Trypoxylus dichotomus]
MRRIIRRRSKHAIQARAPERQTLGGCRRLAPVNSGSVKLTALRSLLQQPRKTKRTIPKKGQYVKCIPCERK